MIVEVPLLLLKLERHLGPAGPSRSKSGGVGAPSGSASYGLMLRHEARVLRIPTAANRSHFHFSLDASI